MSHVLNELVGSGLVLGLRGDGKCRATVFGGDFLAFLPLRQLGDAPVAGLIGGAGHEVDRHPSADGQGGEGAIVELAVPIVGPVRGFGVHEVFVDELLDELDIALHALVLGHVDGDVLAIDLPRLGTGLPDLGGERLIVVGGTGQIGDVGAGGTDLLGGLVVVVPGLDGLAVHAGLVEHCLVVEEHFGAGINRQSVRLVVVLELVPRAGGEVVGEFVGAEFTQVHEAIGDGELGDGRIFEHHDVRGAVACGDGVGERGGGLLGGAGVVELDGDAGVGLLEVSEDFLHRVAGIPAPEHEFGLVSVTLVGAVVVAAAAGGETDERGHGCRCRDDLLGVAHVISFWTIGVDLRVVGFLPTGFRFSSGYFSVIFRLSLAAFRLLTTAFRLQKTNRLLRWISIRLAACEVSSGHLSLGCFLWYTRVPIPKMIHLCTNLSNHPTRLIFFAFSMLST